MLEHGERKLKLVQEHGSQFIVDPLTTELYKHSIVKKTSNKTIRLWTHQPDVSFHQACHPSEDGRGAADCRRSRCHQWQWQGNQTTASSPAVDPLSDTDKEQITHESPTFASSSATKKRRATAEVDDNVPKQRRMYGGLSQCSISQ
jgi:hypothetical protein